MMRVRKLIAASVCGTIIGAFGSAQAQQVQQAQPAQTRPAQPQAGQVQGQANTAGQRSHWQSNDQVMATCVAIDNQEEIAIAKFAAEKARNEEVKDFAQMLSKDHQTFLQKLQRYAPEATRDGYLMDKKSTNDNSRRQDSTQRTNGVDFKVQPVDEPRKDQPVQQAAGTAPAAASQNAQQQNAQQQNAQQQNAQQNAQQQNAQHQQSGQHFDIVALHKEIAEECVAQSKEELGKKDGSKFDECFIGQQIAKHAAMKVKLTVLQRHASGELNQLLREGQDATEKHLKKAEDIMKKLADNRSDSDSKSSKSNRESKTSSESK